MLSYWYPVVYHLTIRNQKDLNTGETQFRMRDAQMKNKVWLLENVIRRVIWFYSSVINGSVPFA